jgi:hypothetical protein
MSAGAVSLSGPVTSVSEAIARMEAIEAVTASQDGLACFNRMYLRVTREVNAELDGPVYSDPVFMARLDVAFANLYFEAVDAADEPATVPLAWRPLIELRAESGIEPIQFALAGMNAHINHDLPLAVIRACLDLSTSPTEGRHIADYKKVNRLLDAAEQSVQQSFESEFELAVDRRLKAVDNAVANWTINSCRNLAWRNSLLLWELRDVVVARNIFLESLATGVALSSRLLLMSVA